MEPISTVLLVNLAFSAALMTCVWIVSLRIRDVSIVDIVWGAAGAMLAITTFFMTDGDPARKLLVVGMTVLWGGRLSLHIGVRSRGKGGDFPGGCGNAPGMAHPLKPPPHDLFPHAGFGRAHARGGPC